MDLRSQELAAASTALHMAAYAVHASAAIGCPRFEMTQVDHGLRATLEGNDAWNLMPQLQRSSLLWDAQSKAMMVADVLVNRQAAKLALKKRPALWMGVRGIFVRYGAMDPLLCEGFSKMLVFILTSLCSKRTTAPLAGLMFLAGGLGIFRGTPFGSPSRNHLATISSIILGLFTITVSMLRPSTVVVSSLPLIAIVLPCVLFIYLQFLPADEMVIVCKVLKSMEQQLKAKSTEAVTIHLPDGTWASEDNLPLLNRVLGRSSGQQV